MRIYTSIKSDDKKSKVSSGNKVQHIEVLAGWGADDNFALLDYSIYCDKTTQGLLFKIIDNNTGELIKKIQYL